MSLFSKKETIELSVTGMHCEKCVGRVAKALEEAEGVTDVTVSLEGKSAVVEGHGIDADSLVVAVHEAGFEASLITS